jgi:hypothetical protein
MQRVGETVISIRFSNSGGESEQRNARSSFTVLGLSDARSTTLGETTQTE